jgi:hypothetical protein
VVKLLREGSIDQLLVKDIKEKYYDVINYISEIISVQNKTSYHANSG